jgi:preprotein translocase subunit SecE
MLDKIKQFLHEVLSEIKKVTWSSKKELVGATVVVIVAILMTTLFIGLVDFTLSKVLALLM